MEWAKDENSTSGAYEANDDDSVITIDAKEAKAKPVKEKQASAETADAETLATITENCEDVFASLQAVAVKYPRVIAAPLSLRADKRTRLVAMLDRRQPSHAAQAGSKRPHGSHGRPNQRGDPVAPRGSASPRRFHLERGRKRDQGVGPPPTNSPARHPGGALQNTALPQCEECRGPPGRFLSNLRR